VTAITAQPLHNQSSFAGFMTFILSVGHASELLSTRSLHLRSAGYSVREENDCQRAMNRAMDDDIDLVLLCHSLYKGEVEFLVNTLAEKRRLLPVLCVRRSDSDMPHDDYAVRSSTPDLLLDQLEILLSLRTT
jgi:DNA-binding response OmpR family regulator